MQPSPCEIVIGGSSITDAMPWPTWASWANRRYATSVFHNTSVKGTGNEAIIMRAINRAQRCHDPIVIVQLTNVDKWDWYVENPDLVAQLNREKHPLILLQHGDLQGFWSTGSHFPLWKQYYKDHYYSLQYHVFHTLFLINWLQLICQAKRWRHYILFDSPILSTTEHQLNTGQLDLSSATTKSLVQSSLCQLISDQIDFSNIYLPGLIGYAAINGFDWYSPKVKGHPGSFVHYQFAKNIIFPVLDLWIESTEASDLMETEAKVMQKLFEKC